MNLSKNLASYALSAINATESAASKATTYAKTKLEQHTQSPSLQEQLELFVDKSGIDKEQARKWLKESNLPWK